MKWSQAIIPGHVIEMKDMNHGVQPDELSVTIVSAIWGEGKAITIDTDGSVHDPISAAYSFVVISIS
jgi:hypothetical protein